MLQFFLGVIVGGVVGFLVCALFRSVDFDNYKKVNTNEKHGDVNDNSR